MRPFFPALVALAAALAGCTAPPGPEAPAGTPAPDPPVPPSTKKGPVAEAPAGAARGVLSLPFAYEGTTEAEACPAAGPHEVCVPLQPARDASWDFPDRRVLRASGEIRWEAATPAAREMHAVLYQLEGGEARYVEGMTVLGASPLGFDWDLAGFPPEARFRMTVYQGHEVYRHPAVVYAGTPQDFEVEGKLVLEAAP